VLGDVRGRGGHGRVVGHVDGDEARADGDSELKIVIMTAAPGSEDETKLRLAAIAGPPAAAYGP